MQKNNRFLRLFFCVKIISYSVNFNFLPVEILLALGLLNINQLTEIRLKSGQPVIIHYRGEYKYLNTGGADGNADGALICKDAEKILENAMGNSVYAYAEQLKYGFITIDGGIRIGIAGEYVTQGGTVISVRDVTSLNIRIPHEIRGCAEGIYGAVTAGGLKSTLLFSPPGYGKTTILRDLARLISVRQKLKVLIADERNEICGESGGLPSFGLGTTCDVIRGASKQFVFENAVRTMAPQVVITDEIYGNGDISALNFISECGLVFIASSHICEREKLKKIPSEYFVELTGIGARAQVYDKNFNFICDCDTVGSPRHGFDRR